MQPQRLRPSNDVTYDVLCKVASGPSLSSKGAVDTAAVVAPRTAEHSLVTIDGRASRVLSVVMVERAWVWIVCAGLLMANAGSFSAARGEHKAVSGRLVRVRRGLSHATDILRE